MERGLTVDQVLGALWRRKLLLGSIAAGVFVLGAAMVVVSPTEYTATAVIRVEPQRPSPEVVLHTVSALIEERLLTVRAELLSRPVLQAVIEELKLYPEIVSEHGMPAAVEEMRRRLTVKVEGTAAFELSYSAAEPDVAAKVANRLPEVFAERTQEIRHLQAARATRLFEDEMKALQADVAQREQRIAQFKRDHLGELPEQLEANLRHLERIGAQRILYSEQLRTAEIRRSDLQRAPHAGDSEMGRLEAAQVELTRRMEGASSQWTADHPEVQRLSREAEALEARRKEVQGRLWAERQERARLIALIARLKQEMASLHRQEKRVQEQLDRTPQWAHELSVLQSDSDAVRAKYHSVVSRKVEAELAEELELRGSATMFSIISPATVPLVPSQPDKLRGLILSLLVALGLALGVGVVLEMRDDTARDLAALGGRLPVPVLAVVPNMQGRVEKRVLAPGRRAEP